MEGGNTLTWPAGPYRWQENEREYISIPFTFNLPDVRDEILNGNLLTGKPIVGGPAVKMMPKYLADIAEIGGDIQGVLQKVNPLATRTTIGCPNKCGFCAIGQGLIEPEYQELEDWPDLPIICDNNLLASSTRHFDRVIDRLKHHKGVDFNQGLDARLLTDYHAQRLAEVDGTIRLAWDHINSEQAVLRAIARLRQAGIPRKRMQCYVLIGCKDTPEDALYRLETVYWSLGILPNPMRYVPLDSLTRHYVGENWTHEELTRMQRYWSNIKHLGGIPYHEFDNKENICNLPGTKCPTGG